MTSKSHCKLRMDGEDEEENEIFEEFFKFPNNNGEPDSDDEEAAAEGSKKNKVTALVVGDEKPKRHVVSMNAGGELILSDGGIVGHRSFLRAYKLNPAPAEERESVLITQMMARHRAITMKGWNKKASTNLHVKDRNILDRKWMKLGIAGNKNNIKHWRDQTGQM